MPAKKKRSTKATVEAIKEAASTGRDLTIKQEAFLHAYLEIGNATLAYRRSYDAEGMSDHAIEVEASRLLRHPEVALRLQEARKKATEAAVLDRAWVLGRLMRNARIAMGEETVRLRVKSAEAEDSVEMDVSDRNGGIANKALELLGKTPELALFIDRKEIGDPGDFARLTDEEIREQAAALAQRLNIPRAPPRGMNGNGSGTKH